VKNIIKSLKTKNSSGYDGISTKLLKISYVLLVHLELIYVTNRYPQEFSLTIWNMQWLNLCLRRVIGLTFLITGPDPYWALSQKWLKRLCRINLKEYRILEEEQLINESLQALNNKSQVGCIFFFI
jgi:phosphatidylserine/phosphatidylglycerophosphate/cardiolipin synthase-like enzyme